MAYRVPKRMNRQARLQVPWVKAAAAAEVAAAVRDPVGPSDVPGDFHGSHSGARGASGSNSGFLVALGAPRNTSQSVRY